MTLSRVLVAAIAILILAWPSCAAARLPHQEPILTPITKDPSTSLYTIPIRLDTNLVLDLAGPLVWSTCASDHLPAWFPCNSSTCKLANAYRVPGCGGGSCNKNKQCNAHPYNPVTGQCAGASLVHSILVANTTDGRNPLTQASVKLLAACAPGKLLSSLPPGAAGVAGLADSGLALPAQVASSHGVPKKFALCLPKSGRGDGVAVFGGGPLFLLQGQPDLTQSLAYTPLLRKKGSPAYFVSVKSIAMDQAPVDVPERALAAGGVVLCTRVPYAYLRADVYRPFVAAFDGARQFGQSVAAVAPFERCFDSRTLPNTRLGYAVPAVTLKLEGGQSWTMTGSNSMVDVDDKTACLAFVEMKGVEAGDGRAPAVIIGGFQMENFLLQFDLEKKQLGFARVPFFTSCSNFNFTEIY